MSIWGKLAGGVAGFAIGGPIGAIVGGLAGHFALDSDWTQEGTSQIAFTIGVIALSAKMAKADGIVTQDEIEAFNRIFEVPPGERENVRRVFDLARQDVAGYDMYAQQLTSLFKDKPGVLEDVLDGLFIIAKADGVVHELEAQYLENVAEIFGFSTGEFARIRSSHLGPDQADPYVILGVQRDIEDRDLKRAYKRLVRENHPDSLIARGVPEEFVQMANDKLASINAAYDQIAKERNL